MAGKDASYDKAMEILNKYSTTEKKSEEVPESDEASSVQLENESVDSPEKSTDVDHAASEKTTPTTVVPEKSTIIESPPEKTETQPYVEKKKSDVIDNKELPEVTEKPRPVIIKQQQKQKPLEVYQEPVVKRKTRVFSCERMASIKKLAATGPTEPDPSSERDIDNASPETVQLCKEFTCHYCMFLYSRPSEVDADTFPFRRKECIAKINDYADEEMKKSLATNPYMKDALRDRRINCIEVNSGCKIRLGDLSGYNSIIRGLPRRRLTIAGPTFSHICVAVQLVEAMFPRLMQYALFPYRLPVISAAKYTSNEHINVSYQDYVTRQPGCMGLLADIDEKGSWRKFLGGSRPKEF